MRNNYDEKIIKGKVFFDKNIFILTPCIYESLSLALLSLANSNPVILPIYLLLSKFFRWFPHLCQNYPRSELSHLYNDVDGSDVIGSW